MTDGHDVAAADLGIARALITCNDDNIGSSTVIERCGGVLERVLPATAEYRRKRHYWAVTS